MSSDDYGELAAALAKAQVAFPAIPRDKEVTVTTKSGGSYKFKYAPLESILSAVRVPLAENGLAISQTLDDDYLVSYLLHSSGARLVGRTPIPQSEGIQAFGSAITYLRRYSIVSLLGIATEEDDDGNAHAGNAASFKERRSADKPDPVRATIRADEPELIGPFSAAGVLGVNKKGTADGFLRQEPDGAVFVVTFTTTEERKVPQVVFRGGLALDVIDAAGGDLNGLVCIVEGDLYRVPYYVGEQKIRKDFDRLEVKRITANGWTLPEPGPDTIPLFSEDEESALDAVVTR